MKKSHISLVCAASALMTGAYFYYRYNIPLSILMLVLVLAVLFYLEKRGFYPAQDGTKKDFFEEAMLSLSVIMILLHVSGSFVPLNPCTDEWTDMMGARMYLSGKRDLFHFMPEYGSALPYLQKILYIILFKLTDNVDYIRVIPGTVFLLSCGSFYLLGREIGGKRTGSAMLFVFSSSSFSFYTSKLALSNSFIPLLASSILYLILRYVREKKIFMILAAGALFFLGFFTYGGWFFFVPVVLTALFIFRKDMGKKAVIFQVAAVAAVSVYAFLLYLSHSNTITRVFDNAPGDKVTGTITAVAGRLLGFPELLMKPLTIVPAFSSALPVFSFTEAIFFAGGLLLLLTGLIPAKNDGDPDGAAPSKRGIYLVVLSGMLFSTASVFFKGPMSHFLKHIMFLTFAVIVSAVFISDKRLYKTYAVFIAVHLFLSFGVFWDMTLFLQQRSKSTDAGKEAADYIKKACPPGNCIVVHETAPYGMQSADMRLISQAYTNPGSKKIFIISNFFFKDILSDNFGAVVKRVFCRAAAENELPVVLYEIKSQGPAMNLYFLDMKSRLQDINFLMWDYDYKSAASLCGKYEKQPVSGALDRFINTLLRLHKMESCFVTDDTRGLYGVFMKDMDRIYMTADFLYYKGKTALRFGDKKTAYDSFIKAKKMAWWFKWPLKYIKELEPEITK